MKKILFSIVAFIATLSMAMAQQLVPLPLDPAVRKGTLPNGLTYYIRHNEWPEQRADFYIAQKVGSMQEEDNQRGLAHFLEHMCFNGTTHFPGNKLKTYLETIGIKFGADLNAYTSFDETVYNINNVPVISNPGAIDSCLLILHDWSHDLLLEGKEIDKERGVINEEWRMRSSAMLRMYEKAFPTLYPDSRYAYRLPIGTMDIVMNFPHKALRDYYKKWYRPDLQALIIVGDIDVDAIEAKIKTMFADIKAPENPAERVYYPVPNNDKPIVSVSQDKEQSTSMAYVMWKEDPIPAEMKPTQVSLVVDYMKAAISDMFDSRINELTQKADAPFIGASVSYSNYLVSKTKDAFTGVTVFKDNGQKEAISALYREILRVQKFGFTATEYARFKSEYKSKLDEAYEQRDKVKNSAHVSELVSNFTENEPSIGIEMEHQIMPMIADQISIDMINQQVMEERTDTNLVIALFLPEKPEITVPTEQEILAIMNDVKKENIEAYKEEVSTEPLVDASKLMGSKIKKQEKGAFDTDVITLKNGIKIVVKKTDYKPNNITMLAKSWGGTSQYNDQQIFQAKFIDNVSIGGIGAFSATDLDKKLAGIQASCNPGINEQHETMSGSCVTKDLESMLQLTYLRFTSPRRDDEAFKSFIQRTKASLQNIELQPTKALQDSIISVLYKNNPRMLSPKAAQMDQVNYDTMLQMYKERFADANDFTFFFIGDIDLETAKPLFEKYLGSLPVLKSKEAAKSISTTITKGEKEVIFEKEQQTPNAITLFVYSAPMEDNLRNGITLSMLQQALTMLFTESVREDEGGAYGVPVQEDLSDYPEALGQIIIQLPTAPEKREKMTGIIYNGIDEMAANGPKAEDLQKIKEYMHRSHSEKIKSNGYWLNIIVSKTMENKDFFNGYDELVDNITAQDIQNMAKKVFKGGNKLVVGMTSPVK